MALLRNWFVFFVLILHVEVNACSLWAVRVEDCEAAREDGIPPCGTFLAKVRDTLPNHDQVVRKIEPEGGYSYVGLFAEGADNSITFSPLKAAVNSEGLAVVYSTPSSLSKEKRYGEWITQEFIHQLVTNHATVKGALEEFKSVRGPRIFLLADRSSLARVEVGLGGEVSIRYQDRGQLVATNHYQSTLLQSLNEKTNEGSLERLEVLVDGLSSKEHPLTSFAQIAKRVHRKGFSLQESRTRAYWFVWVPEQGPPQLRYQLF